MVGFWRISYQHISSSACKATPAPKGFPNIGPAALLLYCYVLVRTLVAVLRVLLTVRTEYGTELKFQISPASYSRHLDETDPAFQQQAAQHVPVIYQLAYSSQLVWLRRTTCCSLFALARTIIGVVVAHEPTLYMPCRMGGNPECWMQIPISPLIISREPPKRTGEERSKQPKKLTDGKPTAKATRASRLRLAGSETGEPLCSIDASFFFVCYVLVRQPHL